MQVSHMKGLAIHHGPESCLDDPQGRREALTRESTGMVLSYERFKFGCRPVFVQGNAIAMAPQDGEAPCIRRSQRPIACTEAPYVEIGRPGKFPSRRHEEEGWYR